MAEINFHWGSESSPGAEHTLQGKQSRAEVQFVHYNTKCGRDLDETMANCQGHDALAVLGL